MDKILDIAIEKDASDVHLIAGNKPILRISRELTPIEVTYNKFTIKLLYFCI